MARNLERFRKVIPAERAVATFQHDGIPGDYRQVRASVYFNEKKLRLVITAYPREDADPDGVIHNCDANGCGWEHVIARLDLTISEARELMIVEAPHAQD